MGNPKANTQRLIAYPGVDPQAPNYHNIYLAGTNWVTHTATTIQTQTNNPNTQTPHTAAPDTHTHTHAPINLLHGQTDTHTI